MAWKAKNFDAVIEVGTALRIRFVPATVDHHPPSIPGGVELIIASPGVMNVQRARTRSRRGDTVMIELEDGTVHSMTPRRPHETPPGAQAEDAAYEVWIIRW